MISFNSKSFTNENFVIFFGWSQGLDDWLCCDLFISLTKVIFCCFQLVFCLIASILQCFLSGFCFLVLFVDFHYVFELTSYFGVNDFLNDLVLFLLC